MTKVETTATFPRSARLLSPGAFTAVFEKRTVRRGRFFHLHIGPSKDIEIGTAQPVNDVIAKKSRIGIAVPKKLLKTAVHRNVVKRIAREVFRQTRYCLDGRDYILRLAVKLDLKKQVLNRKAIANDIRVLFAGRQNRDLLKDSREFTSAAKTSLLSQSTK